MAEEVLDEMAEEVLDEIPNEECENDCCFDVDTDYSSRLLDSFSTATPCFCSSDIIVTKTSFFLSSWDSCDNHGEMIDNSSFNGCGRVDIKEDRKRQRYPGSSSALPFGQKKTDFVFQHYNRRNSYIEQYRYNHTFGGTGQGLPNAHIAQTLMSYLKNEKLKFPIISGHDVNLVNSVSHLVESPDSSLLSVDSPTRNPIHEDSTPSPSTKTCRLAPVGSRSSHDEGDSLVLPKIKIKENIQSHKVGSCKERKGDAKGKNLKVKMTAGLVQLDNRPTDDAIKRDSYWWNNNEMPYTGKKNDFPESKGRHSTLSTRSEDFALVFSPAKKKKSRPVRTSSLGSMSHSGNLIHQDVFNTRGKLATKETIQCLLKFFISDRNVKSGDICSTGFETSNKSKSGYRMNSFDCNVNHSRRHGLLAVSNDITNELKVNGVSGSNEDDKRTSRYNMCKGYPLSATQSGRHQIKIPIRCAVPLSEDTVLLGAPYRTEEEHRIRDQENVDSRHSKKELVDSLLDR